MEAPEKLNPIQRIARELEPSSSLSEEDLERSFVGIMDLLQRRAEDEIGLDPESDASEAAAREFLAFTEMMTMFGGSLLAYDEIEPPGDGEEGLKN